MIVSFYVRLILQLLCEFTNAFSFFPFSFCVASQFYEFNVILMIFLIFYCHFHEFFIIKPMIFFSLSYFLTFLRFFSLISRISINFVSFVPISNMMKFITFLLHQIMQLLRRIWRAQRTRERRKERPCSHAPRAHYCIIILTANGAKCGGDSTQLLQCMLCSEWTENLNRAFTRTAMISQSKIVFGYF